MASADSFSITMNVATHGATLSNCMSRRSPPLRGQARAAGPNKNVNFHHSRVKCAILARARHLHILCFAALHLPYPVKSELRFVVQTCSRTWHWPNDGDLLSPFGTSTILVSYAVSVRQLVDLHSGFLLTELHSSAIAFG